ncbi:MAG: MopE-related protein [Pseudomonadota bacterium]|nr:MopE-related protein [Pseudomonadota bacterium]
MFLVALLPACLINTELYDSRKEELTDHDGDSFLWQDDCDDADASVFPGATEVCDGVDNDCQGGVDVDAADAPSWFPDGDLDGYGASVATPVVACDAPAGSVANSLDCDDDEDGIRPDATEVPYDGIDDDCDGADLDDVDHDGWPAIIAGGGDCDDTDATVNPAASEEPYDGVDQDCQGGDADDLDGDGSTPPEAGGEDCDDTDATRFPAAPETWADGLTDNDCDGDLESVRLDFGTEAWVGESAGDQAGRRLGALGDVTGDGLVDYLVGAVYQGSHYAYGGAVYLVEGGSPSGDLADANVLLPGADNWFLPQVVEGGPDVDGDGVPDLVATATGYESASGAAFLVSGAAFATSPSLSLPEAALGLVSGDHDGDYGGTGAAFLGDVMGDGGEYLAVSSLFADNGTHLSAGVVSVHDARALGSSRVSEGEVFVAGPYADAGIGNLVAPAGDVDGDGVDDYLVSASYGDLAYVLPGGVEAPILPDDAIFRLTAAFADETGSVEMLGDVDGDGARDLALLFEFNQLRVFTTLAAAPVRTVEEETATIWLGEGSLAYDVLDIGDIDGDGKAETYVPVQWYPGIESSFAAIVFGDLLDVRATVDIADSTLTAASLRSNGRFGYRVALSDDVDGDGGKDILVGGYSDSEAGTDAGAVLTVPVPR